jgi:probable HAF family extracellular repeat protein
LTRRTVLAQEEQMNARNEAVGDAVHAPVAAIQAATRYRIVPIFTPAFGRLNERNQVAYNEPLPEGRSAGRFYDGMRIRPLGTLGGATTFVNALNNFEQVTGYSTIDATERGHAFRWSPAMGMVDLGTTRGGDESEGYDINNMGEVAGVVRFPDERPTRAVLWRPGERALDLGLNGGVTGALYINDRGQVAGTTLDGAGKPQAFRWSRTERVVLLDEPGVFSAEVRDINASGQITGSHANTPEGGIIPFLWTPGQEFLPLFDRAAFPFAMNDAGMVVGVLLDQIAFAWSRADGLSILGFPGDGFSNAYDVNNHGVVVGQAQNGNALHAFLWTRAGGMVDLNDRVIPQSNGFELTLAFEINDQGTILSHTTDGTLVLLVPFPGA